VASKSRLITLWTGQDKAHRGHAYPEEREYGIKPIVPSKSTKEQSNKEANECVLWKINSPTGRGECFSFFGGDGKI